MVRYIIYSFFCFFSFSVLASDTNQIHFESKVRPLLHEKCISCHGPEKQKSGLRLDHITFIKEGGEHGEVVNFDHLNQSKLLLAIQHKLPDLVMPPKKSNKKLTHEEIDLLSNWILKGVYWPEEQAPVTSHFIPGKIQQQDREWWAFQSFDNTHPPTLKSTWSKNPLDLFVEQKLHQQQLTPAPEAEKRELIRRIYYDLIGLPPSPEEVLDFLEDKSDDAYERLVDRLLNSPKYGERWAQHWLDVVRYAESDGYRGDHYRPQAHQYRDYVINSFNQDKPYDQFIHEQIAGDEINPGSREALTATMFLRHWIYEWNQRDVMSQWDLILNDITETTADAFMGMSLACARCHNHKFDPIMQKDFYRFQAFFKAIRPREDMPIANLTKRQDYESQMSQWKVSTADIRYQIHDIEYPILLKKAKGEGFSKFVPEIQAMMLKHPEKRSGYETQIAEMALRQVKIDRKGSGNFLIEHQPTLDRLNAKLKKFDHLKPKKLPTMKFAISDTGRLAPETLIPDSKDQTAIQPGFLEILDPKPATIHPTPKALNSTGRRSALAYWLTQNNNPLTARVMVNRIWQRHFKQGIVATPNNFGRLGERPTHPELLDWLAKQLVEGGWKMKRIHKLICTSATYRQTSRVPPSTIAMEIDPNNKYLWRYPPLRLDAEQIRDSILKISGKLNETKQGGAAVESKANKRSIYLKKYRNTPDQLMNRFNASLNFKSTPTRNITNTPLQSLLLLNSKWPLEQSKSMAHQIIELYSQPSERIKRVFNLAYARNPNSSELKSSLNFLEQQTVNQKSSELQALTDFCHVVINSNEFINLH